jgi:GTP-binding protein Era
VINYSNPDFKSGFIAVVGKPNVGKSSLVNHIVGRKVAIVTSKPQTTRHRVLGVKNRNNCQIVFVDTPGIHNPEHELGKFMEKTYMGEMNDAEVILFLADSTHDIRDEDEIALKHLFGGKKQPNAPVFLVMNRIDISDPEKVKTREQVFQSKGNFINTYHISALTGEGVEEMEQQIADILPPGPPYFPPDQDSDQTIEFQASEIIREKVLEKTRQEIPHCVFVHTEEIREGETPDITYIRAIVYVERKSQKGILIGKNGLMLKDIGCLARQDLEPLFKTKVYLDLWVKIKDDWRDRKDLLKSWGYQI